MLCIELQGSMVHWPQVCLMLSVAPLVLSVRRYNAKEKELLPLAVVMSQCVRVTAGESPVGSQTS